MPIDAQRATRPTLHSQGGLRPPPAKAELNLGGLLDLLETKLKKDLTQQQGPPVSRSANVSSEGNRDVKVSRRGARLLRSADGSHEEAPPPVKPRTNVHSRIVDKILDRLLQAPNGHLGSSTLQRHNEEQEKIEKLLGTVGEEQVDLKDRQVNLYNLHRDDPAFLAEVRRQTAEVVALRDREFRQMQAHRVKEELEYHRSTTAAWFSDVAPPGVHSRLAKGSEKRLQDLAHHQASREVGVELERRKLQHSVTDVMTAVADVLAEEFNVKGARSRAGTTGMLESRGRVATQGSPRGGTAYRNPKNGYAIGLPPSIAPEELDKLDMAQIIAHKDFKTELRNRKERLEPNTVIPPLDWEMTVVNYNINPTTSEDEDRRRRMKEGNLLPSYMRHTQNHLNRFPVGSNEANKRSFTAPGGLEDAAMELSASMELAEEKSANSLKRAMTINKTARGLSKLVPAGLKKSPAVKTYMVASVQTGGSVRLPQLSETSSQNEYGPSSSRAPSGKERYTPKQKRRSNKEGPLPSPHSVSHHSIRTMSSRQSSARYTPSGSELGGGGADKQLGCEPVDDMHRTWFAQIHDEDVQQESPVDPDARAMRNTEHQLRVEKPQLFELFSDWAAQNEDSTHAKELMKEVAAYNSSNLMIPVLKREVTTADQRASVESYNAGCHSLNIVPLTRVFEQMKLPDACLGNLNLGSKGGQALAECLANNQIVSRLYIRSNNFSQQACLQITNSLPMNRHLTELDMSENQLGREAVAVLAHMLTSGKKHGPPLRVLNLSHCGLGNEGATLLARSLIPNYVLTDLIVQHNQIGDKGADGFGELLAKGGKLQRLDLAWNNIKAAGAEHLAQGLEQNGSLCVLNLAWNGLGNQGGVILGMTLHINQGLKELDISNTRVGGEAAMVIAEALKHNHHLAVLNISENPIGEDGGRHLMIGLQENEALQAMSFKGCNLSKKADTGWASFNPRSAEGPFKLKLQEPVHRTLALQLIELGRINKKRWTKVKLDRKPITFDADALDWPSKLPEKGLLELNYVMLNGGNRPMIALEDADLCNLIDQLGSQWLSDVERLTLLQMFTAQSFLSCQQVPSLVRSFTPNGEEKQKALIHCWSALIDLENSDQMYSALTLKERNSFLQRLGPLQYFRNKNPTGHYELDFSVEFHCMLFRQLCNIAYYEGEALNWRNVSHEQMHEYALDGCPKEWIKQQPASGVLRLDYVTSNLADYSFVTNPQTSQLLVDEDSLLELMEEVQPGPRNPSELCVSKLRVASVHLYLSCEQCGRLVSLFTGQDERVEAVVILFARLIDRENFWTVLYQLGSMEQSSVCERIGYGTTFDDKHPCGHYRLDTTHPEQMAVCKSLMTIAQKNRGFQNWHNVFVQGRLLKTKVVEDSSMWSLFTVQFATPLLEFDFFGEDVFTYFFKAKPDLVEKCNILVDGLATRRRLDRCRALHPYWVEISGWTGGPSMAAKKEFIFDEGVGGGLTGRKNEATPREGRRPTPPKGGWGREESRERERGTSKEKPAKLTKGQSGANSMDQLAGDRTKLVKMTQEKWDLMFDKVQGGYLEMELAKINATRPYHWQTGWDHTMRKVLDLEGPNIVMSPVYDYFWERLDPEKKGMVPFKVFHRHLKMTFGFTTAEADRLALKFDSMDLNEDDFLQFNEFEDALMAGTLTVVKKARKGSVDGDAVMDIDDDNFESGMPDSP